MIHSTLVSSGIIGALCNLCSVRHLYDRECCVVILLCHGISADKNVMGRSAFACKSYF